MNKLFKQNFLFFLILFPAILQAQPIQFFEFTVSTANVPGGHKQTEKYLKAQHKTKRSSNIVHWKNRRKTIRKNLPVEQNIHQVISMLDSLIQLSVFKVYITPGFIDTLKTRENLKSAYRISNRDIDRFFSKKDTLILNLNRIEQNITESFIIDGLPFRFILKIQHSEKDTNRFEFSGNFLDDVPAGSIRKWLPMYLTYRKHPFFSTIKPMATYFSDRNFENMLFRFIASAKLPNNQ